MIFEVNEINERLLNTIIDSYDSGIRNFQFSIDSCGGSLDIAMRIYDMLRSDPECVVSCDVNGMCASAATVILLTAPKERRTASPHSVFMCHSPLLPVTENVNLKSAESIHNTLSKAYTQLKSIYEDRTDSSSVIEAYMDNEREFYTDEAIKLGFIGSKNILYNNYNNRMSKIRNLINSIISQLKNETFETKDGQAFEALSLEVGAPVEGLSDGVYELTTGEVITIESGVIIDIIVKEETPVEEPATEEKPAEPANEETLVEEKKEEVAQTIEEVAQQVEEAVSEEEIKQIVEEAISELRTELENKYKPMAEMISNFGGMERLKMLKNAVDAKHFDSKPAEEKKRKTVEELMSL